MSESHSHSANAASLNILLPVRNEHARLERGVLRSVEYLDGLLPGDYLVTIVDNGSDDDTPDIARRLEARCPGVRYLRIERRGVGAAFVAGVAVNECPVVGYMDVDLSTDVAHLADVVRLFCADAGLGIVNGSRWAAESSASGRKWYRMLTSHGLVRALRAGLGMRATDAICGFKFFRKEVAEALIAEAGALDDDWFGIIELLVRAERGGVRIHELPVRWEDDRDTTVHVAKQIVSYLASIARLRRKLAREARAADGVRG